ncbi:MAG: acetylornithine carbamoyltransferase, partial [Bacteroidetes bacterium]|nr:acetylornithine carbamoyltransferase [Bacteroidota bacterium]
MNHFLSLQDVPDLNQIITAGIIAKRNPFSDKELGRNKTIGLLFFNSSLRTRLSTQKAAQNLGLNVLIMNVGQDGWGLEMEESEDGKAVIMNGANAEHVK